VAWDAPAHYGVACKREDLRDPDAGAPSTAAGPCPRPWPGVADVRAEVVVLSYNNESWLSFDELHDSCAARGHVEVLAFDSPRYVGARIGIHDPAGRKVGAVSHLRNTEYVLVAGDRSRVRPWRRRWPTPAWASASWTVRFRRPVQPGHLCRFDLGGGPCQRGRAHRPLGVTRGRPTGGVAADMGD
jgi:hypothetical protein